MTNEADVCINSGWLLLNIFVCSLDPSKDPSKGNNVCYPLSNII